MGVAHRMAEVFRAKANTALERAEDPRELLDYCHTLQQDLLVRVRRDVADIATSRESIEHREKRLRESAGRLQGRAEQVPDAGDEELASKLLFRRGLRGRFVQTGSNGIPMDRRVHADLAGWGTACGPELVRFIMRGLGLEPCRPWAVPGPRRSLEARNGQAETAKTGG